MRPHTAFHPPAWLVPAVIIIGVLNAGLLSAQAPRRSDTLSYPFRVTKAGVSLWGPGSNGGSASANLFSVGLGSSTTAGSKQTWDLPTWANNLGIPDPSIGGSFSFSSNGSIGSSASLGVSGGTFSFDYPGTLRIIVPAPNTFGSGVPAVIRSEVLPGSGGSLTVITPPTPTLALNGSFGSFSARMDGEVCFVSCSGSLSSLFGGLHLSLPAANGALLGLSDGWFTLAGEKVFPVTESVSDLKAQAQRGTIRLTKVNYQCPLGGFCSLLKPELDREKGTQVDYPYLYLPASVVPPGSSFCDATGIPSTFQETKQVPGFFTYASVTWTVSGGALPPDQCVVAAAGIGGAPASLSFDPLQKLGINGTLHAPSFGLSTTLRNGALVATGDSQFGDFTLSTLRLLGNAQPQLMVLSYWEHAYKDFGIPNVFDGHASARINYDLIDVKQDFQLRQDQTLALTPAIHIAIALPDGATWTVLDHGTPRAHGTGKAVFEPGQDLEVVLPGSAPRNVVPQVTVIPTVNNEVGFTLRGDTRYKSLFGNIRWELYVSVVNNTLLDWSQPVGFGPFVNNVIPGSSFSQRIPVASAHFTLDPVAGPAFDAFTLDPENPQIVVRTNIVNALTALRAYPGHVLQTITVQNAGDVPLALHDVIDSLSKTGWAVVKVASSDVTINSLFDGFAHPQALGAGAIAVGHSAVLTVLATAPAGQMYTAKVDAAGTSPIGTRVSATAAARLASFGFTIKPRRFNTESDGKLRAVVYGSPALDVDAINRASLAMLGVRPSKITRKDVNDDCHADLVLRFDRRAVAAAMKAAAALPAASRSPIGVALGAGAGLQGNVSVADAARRLLAGATLADASSLDRNGNGRFDIGDLRALVLADVSRVGAAAASKDSNTGGGNGLQTSHNGPSCHAEGDNHETPDDPDSGHYDVRPDDLTMTMVLLGTLKDGTPLMGEDQLTLTHED